MESEFIAWLRKRLPPDRPDVDTGIGDDAAVLKVSPGARIVVTTDALSDGIDFHLLAAGSASSTSNESTHRSTRQLGAATLREAGYKALAVNLSDLAAMAARPVAAFVSLVLPTTGALQAAQDMIEGLLPLAEEHAMTIAGGDTNTWSDRLVISITAIGETQPIRCDGESLQHGVWRRSGAQVGDVILATGEFGGSLLGRHLHPIPRVREATRLATRYRIHAAVDVSDGLTLDLSHLAESSHCGVLLDLAAIPIAPAAQEMARQAGDSRSPLEHALCDGEDFELLLAVPATEVPQILADAELGVRITPIGHCIPETGLWVDAGANQLRPLPPRGYRHG
ncbi:MAG: Thiamine-monophosphate kinase [Planctomycetota bacterium]